MADIFLYTDGGIITRNPSPWGGVWAWRIVADDDETVLKSGSGLILARDAKPPQGEAEMLDCRETDFAEVENNYTEMVAAVEGLLRTVRDDNIILGCDNQNTLRRLTDSRTTWNGIPEVLKERALSLASTRSITPKLLSGHPTLSQLRSGIGKRGTPVSKHNRWCDQECNRVKKIYLDNL